MDQKESDILSNEDLLQHWYYKSKAKAMMQILGKNRPSTILDVGAGSGFFSRYLMDNTSAKDAWCIDTNYDNDLDDYWNEKPIHYRQSIENIDADLVLLMDVLEHVDDDFGLLKSYVDKVPIGTQFLISVPAFQFLWSGHDDFLEHKRRYQLHQIENVARSAGLTVKSSSYYFGLVFPIAAITRLLHRLNRRNTLVKSQLTRHSPLVNNTLSAICNIELPLMKFNRVAGLTAFCLVEKSL
jgi:hypothetical protein